MATTTHIPVEVYLRSSCEPDAEYVDGRMEILSPEDRVQRLKHKLEDDRAMGIPEIWVIDPLDRTFWRYEDQQLRRTDAFSHAGKGIAFDRNELKNLLD